MSEAQFMAGVIGWPVAHSRSPRIHGYWLKKHGIDGQYVLLAVETENLEQELSSLPARRFRGVNVTIPHKEAVIKYLDEVDRIAQKVGAVNMIVISGEGKLSGSNTDVFGFMENIKEVPVGTALVLGAGGASRAVAVALQEKGFNEIRIANRTKDRAKKIAEELGGNIKVVDWEEKENAFENVKLLVNTTSLGMTGQPPLEINLDNLPKEAWVTDAVYVPLETDLLKLAAKRGHRTVDGLGMLLHQARPAFKAWFGVDPDVDEELRKFVMEV